MATTPTTYAASGTKIYIASGAPATADAVGLAAMTWKQVGKVTNYTPGSDDAEIMSREYLEDEAEDKQKGIIRTGNAVINVDVVDGSEGQSMCRTALTDKAAYYLKTEYPNGRIRFAQVLVAGYSETDMQPNGMVSATITMARQLIATAAGNVRFIETPAA